MNYQDIKGLFNNEWISRLCDDLSSDNKFVQRNKVSILESLLVAINNSLDLSIPMFKEQREAYFFISEEIEKELEMHCYVV